MIPYPRQFHMLPDHPRHHTLNKGSLSPPTLLAQFVPTVYHPYHQFYHSSVCTSRSCQGNIIALIVAGLPLSTTAPLFQRIDPEALRLGPITICGECLRTILRGVIIASPNGCFSHARLQYLIRIVENRAGFICPFHFVSKTPDFPRL